LLAACASPPPVRLEPYEDEVLEGARRAIGYDQLLDHTGGFEFIGERSEALGSSTFRFSFDNAGRSILDVTGAIPRAEGCDGIETWSQDPSGLIRILGLGEAERVRCESWLRTGLWLDPWVPRFTSSIDRRRSLPGRVAVELRRPDTPFRATVWIDEATKLPAEYEIRGTGRRVSLEDYARVSGARFPQRFVHTFAAGGGQVIEQIQVANATSLPSFAAPRPKPRDTTFDTLGSPDLRARRGDDGRLYVDATLDGTHEVTLLLDTGFGASGVRSALAEKLGWPVLGDASLSGVAGRSDSRWRRSGSLDLGPLTVKGLDLIEVDLPLAKAGFEVHGVLGADVLARAAFELAPSEGLVRVFEPGRLEHKDLPWVPVRFAGTAPCFEARFGKSEPLWVRLDTGSNDTLSVAPWAVEAYNLAPNPAALETVYLVGSFGSRRGWRGELPVVELAGQRLLRAPATFLAPSSSPSPLDDPWIAGNLGLPLVRAAHLYLDLPRQRLALVPDR